MKNWVILDYDPGWKAEAWARAHCPTYITNTGDAVEMKIKYYFSMTEQGQQEMLLFAIRWA